MKMKSMLTGAAMLLVGSTVSNAATFAISNIGDLLNDRLYAYENNSLMNPVDGGVVTIGYFTSTVTLGDINTIAGLFANLGNFTTMSSSTPGLAMPALGDLAVNGYADNTTTGTTSTGAVLAGNPLLGRTVYSIVTNAPSLGSATSTSQFALVQIGVINDEGAGEVGFSSNPVNAPIIGTVGSLNADLGFGPGTYSTLKMASIPEPSAALLGALGALGLLRRRRA